MKTTILISAMVLMMTAANALPLADTNKMTGYPEQVFQASLTKADNNIIQFGLKNPDKEKVILKVYDDEMVKIYQRNLKSEKAILGLDLSNCCKGKYTIIVSRNGNEEIRKEFSVK